MVDALDLLSCQQCGTFFVPEPEQRTEVKICKRCQGVVRDLLTERVVILPLTGTFLDMEG